MALIVIPNIAFAYQDVPKDRWSYPYVFQLTKDGVFDSRSSFFFPEENMTRAELVKVIVESKLGVISNLPETSTFKDVDVNSLYSSYLETGVKLGFIKGDTDANGVPTGKFRPNDPINRAEMSKMIINAYDISGYEKNTGVFFDVEPGVWYEGYVYNLYNWSIVDGYSNAQGDFSGLFGVNDFVTREQVSKIIVNAGTPKLRDM